MSGIGSGYDLSVGTFSPDGRVFQTDYAQKAVDNGGTVIGVRCSDGVVLGVENLFVSKMLEPGTNTRTHPVSKHAGVALSGVAADGRQVALRAQGEALGYRNTYGSPIPGKILCDRVASYVHAFNLYWYVRPFGCVTLLATFDDEEGPALYAIDPAGGAFRYFGTAVGKGRQAAKTEIERLNLKELKCEQALVEVAKILHSVHEGEKPFELELSWICDANGRKFERVPADKVAAAEAEAKAALAESDMDD